MELDQTKPVVYCGDLNVAHQEIDLKNPKSNRMNPGFSDEERAKMTQLSRKRLYGYLPRISIRIRPAHTPGGAIASMPGRTTPDGASTILSSPTG